MRAHIVGDGLEVAEDLLGLVDNGLVAEHRAVVCEVDGRRLGRELAMDALGVGIALPERLEGRDGLCRVEYEHMSVSSPSSPVHNARKY